METVRPDYAKDVREFLDEIHEKAALGGVQNSFGPVIEAKKTLIVAIFAALEARIETLQEEQ